MSDEDTPSDRDDEVRRLRQALETSAAEIGAAIGAVSGAVASAWWPGDDADRFRAQWSDRTVPELAEVIAALTEASETLRRN